ncbi:MAG: gsiC3 [Solirubrobacterales bacterium]|nr:gsiC3 [Solirubrobacterales bacterium]
MSPQPELAAAGNVPGAPAEAAAGGSGGRLVPYLRFIARRLGALLVVVWVVEIATFLIVRLMPGDPARQVLGPRASPQAIAVVRHQLGLDKSWIDQYLDYTWHALRLDFGESFTSHIPVSTELSTRVGNELELIGIAVALIVVLGLAAGILAGALTANGRRPLVERVFVFTCGLLGSVPGYVAATLLALGFAVTWKLFPVAGNDQADSVVLPALAIAIPQAALLARIVRVETLGVLGQNYIRGARSKRLGWGRVYGRYVLPNVLTAALTLGGTIFAQSIGSAIIVETIFAWNGLGLLLTQAVLRLNFPVIEGASLVLALVVVLVNALVDIVVSLIDPRSAAQRGLELG